MMITEETRIKISKAMTGIIRSDETRKKMRDAHLGRRPSQATRARMRLSALSRWARVREVPARMPDK
jgi:hypothetical protein